jgi:ubiquinone/menaquinone biosynthesis C-methylase UbiE
MTTTSARQQVYTDGFEARAAENYERWFVPVIPRPLATDLLHEAGLRRGNCVLDVACGTGIVARLAAEHVSPGGSVAGVDVNPGMLALARNLASSSPAPITWYETSAEAMPLPDGAFDVVFCQLGLQFVADKRAALGEMRRVAAPGGRVYVSVPAPAALFDEMERAFAHHGIAPAAGFTRLVFGLNDPRELERLFRDAGFDDVEVRVDTKHPRLPGPREFLWQYVDSTPMAPAFGGLEPERRTALEQDIVDRWQPWTNNGGMTYAQPILVGIARR